MIKTIMKPESLLNQNLSCFLKCLLNKLLFLLLVKQYPIHKKIIIYNMIVAVTVTNGLICLRFC